ncbi:LytR/AlgR family response regulator transcription factor [Aequorivita sublithincola]|uniref:LytR/AlgR family response regulator transcription factor n=1 Tax=Aequorivita sublithincola TaxID=101385 RepID=UPI001FE00FF3|nr:LytTR family DNA-binding domain-containing protein [Aequorivita sublithincola]
MAPIFIHLALLTFVFIFLSVLFYNGRYDIYKILTYTLANDLYKLVLVYSIFVIAHRYLSYRITDIVSLDNKSYISKIIIGNGKNNTVVKVNDIYQITAETPYISIQLNDKKYLHTETLKSMSTQLDNKVFVRVHKSSIINLDKVVSLKSRLNGDYDITLKNGAEIRLSRNYVADFKSKLKLTHQVTT